MTSTVTELDEVTKIEEFKEEESTTKISDSDKETVIKTVSELDEVTKIEEFKEEESTTKISESNKETVTKTLTELDDVTKIEEFKEEESTTKISESDKEAVTETVTELEEVTKIEESREDESTIQNQNTSFVMFTKLLEHKEAVFGETVEFTCEISQTGVEVTWLRNNQPLSLSESRYQMVSQDYSYKLIIANVMEEDLGEYSVRFGELDSSAILFAKG